MRAYSHPVEETTMFKAVCLIRRKPDMSMVDFIDRYENGHAVLCATLIPNMVKYIRRYVTAGDVVRYEGAPALDFDVVTELWFDSRETYDEAMASLQDSTKAALLAKDERELFEMTSIRRFVVEERESNLGR
jgi:hypothetical protein